MEQPHLIAIENEIDLLLDEKLSILSTGDKIDLLENLKSNLEKRINIEIVKDDY